MGVLARACAALSFSRAPFASPFSRRRRPWLKSSRACATSTAEGCCASATPIGEPTARATPRRSAGVKRLKDVFLIVRGRGGRGLDRLLVGEWDRRQWRVDDGRAVVRWGARPEGTPPRIDVGDD